MKKVAIVGIVFTLLSVPREVSAQVFQDTIKTNIVVKGCDTCEISIIPGFKVRKSLCTCDDPEMYHFIDNMWETVIFLDTKKKPIKGVVGEFIGQR